MAKRRGRQKFDGVGFAIGIVVAMIGGLVMLVRSAVRALATRTKSGPGRIEVGNPVSGLPRGPLTDEYGLPIRPAPAWMSASGVRFWMSTCVDTSTGRSFDLRLGGTDEDNARAYASAWGFVTGPLIPTALKPRGRGGFVRSYGRNLQEYDPGVVGTAIVSTGQYEIEPLLAVLDHDCEWRDRHHLLQGVMMAAYTLRERLPAMKTVCEMTCWQWFVEAPFLIQDIVRHREELGVDGKMIGVVAPERLSILLEKDGFPERAAQICRLAVRLNLSSADIAALEHRAWKVEQRLAKKAAKKKG